VALGRDPAKRGRLLAGRRGSGGLAAGGAVQSAEGAIEAAVSPARAGLALWVGALDGGFLAAAAIPGASTPAAQAIAVAGNVSKRPAELEDRAHRQDDTGKLRLGRGGRAMLRLSAGSTAEVTGRE
jgi:hypothetical protein